jgi:predicted metalloprotease with PDZ domain
MEIRDLAVSGFVMAALLATQPAAGETGLAKYDVRLLRVEPPRLLIHATLPIDGQALEMGTSRPADVPELATAGWPALVANLRVSDAAGENLEVKSAGPAGWLLAKPHSGRLAIEYEVDYQPLSKRGWPAPREAAFADADHLVVLGRSLFITTRESGSAAVTFGLPHGWRPVVPWRSDLTADSPEDLTENLLVFTRSEPDVMTAGGFRLLVTAMGHWQAVRPDVRAMLGPVIQHFVKLMGYDEQESYSVVLLPILDRGGEAFRNSFAMSLDVPPSSANRSDWGNTIAHEVFHYWNGSRLRGADYATSQWFQEGFTEYVANVSMAVGMADLDGFRKKLSTHVGNYRKLATTLEGGGTRKGPPLYSAGALVAFSWDVMIRDATGGKRNLGDFLRELWRRTDRGQRPWEWSDLQAALEATAPLDWQSFHGAHIRGDKPLPLAEIFARAGLRLVQSEDGSPRVELDPAASASAASLWKGLVAD